MRACKKQANTNYFSKRIANYSRLIKLCKLYQNLFLSFRRFCFGFVQVFAYVIDKIIEFVF